MIDVLIIGGGASALSCAIELKRINKELKVTILERLDKVGKKILATGGGRCNLSNEVITRDKYHSDNKEFINSINYDESIKYVKDFFKSINVLLRKDNNLIYPYSNLASSIQKVLEEQLELNNIDVIYNYECQSIKKEKDYYIVTNGAKELKAKVVVIATGGMSSSFLGSNGSGYKLLENLGHTTTKLSPGLVQLKLKESVTKDLKGQRAYARLSLYKEKVLIKSLDGEILFTDYGISGICIMDLSSLIKEGTYYIKIDLMKEYSLEEVKRILLDKINSNKSIKVDSLLNGIINTKMGLSIINSVVTKKDISNEDIDKIASTLKEWVFTYDGKLSFDTSQVTCGGINTKEINYNTFESKINNNLYIIGELLDIDGECGGYNLHFAWYSGIIAARSITSR